MKKYEIYKNIRKRAVIFGLPLPLFALMMGSIIASQLVIIFSFSFILVVGVTLFNAILFIALSRFTKAKGMLSLRSIFPKHISNQQNTGLDYENH